jgi:GMP synthase (glutamine-hydrolysing)
VSASILVVEHEANCPPGRMGPWLESAGAALDMCRPYAGDVLPDSLERHDGLLVLGGSMGANDDAEHAWLAPLKTLIRTTDRPVLGICLGHQLVAAAYGGRVARNPRGQQLGLLELGWTAAAPDDPLMGGLATPRRGIQWNDDIVTMLPPQAVVLAATPEAEPQAVRFAPLAWGVQLHPEADEQIVGTWAEGDADRHLAQGVDQAKLLREIAESRPELDRAWRPLAERFVELVTTP